MLTYSKQFHTETLKTSLEHLPEKDTVTLWWLGQAGFAIQSQRKLIFIDPYLSNFLAKKYQGRFFPHTRMMPSPIVPANVQGLDVVLCTHRHSDHLDPETAPILAKNNSGCTVVVPKSARDWSIEIGIPAQQLQTIDSGEQLMLGQGIRVQALPSAHENLQVNELGEHVFLGYIVELGDLKLYHSGDCIPYPGLAESLRSHSIDLALLPVNGRDEYRQSHGIPGNFTLEEAVSLCKETQIPNLICHHFGMFDFNTIDPQEAKDELQRIREGRNYILAQTGIKYMLTL